MFSTRSEYDRGVNTFSPEGRLFQVEYALGAIKLGTTSIGIQTDEGVLLASEKRVHSCLLVSQSVQKILEIDSHIGCAMSGLAADARTLIGHAHVECQNHFFTYNEKLPVESCVEAIADVSLSFSDATSKRRGKRMSRPFGVALLVGGVDSQGPSLWCCDSSGTTTNYKAAAIGSGQEGAESLLQDSYTSSMSLAEAETLALSVIRHVMEDKLSSNNVELSSIRTDTQMYHKYSSEEVQKVIERLPPPTVPTASTLAAGSS